MYMIVLIIKIIDWNRFANQVIDLSKNQQCITHHLDISDLYVYITTIPNGGGPDACLESQRSRARLLLWNLSFKETKCFLPVQL